MLVAEIDLISRFFNFLMRNPSPSEVMGIKVSDAENQRFMELSEKKQVEPSHLMRFRNLAIS
jgi:hypothetical protein